MESNVNHVLASVTETIMEQVGFIFIDEVITACETDTSGWRGIGAKVSFSGVQNGAIHLWISTQLAQEITANMLAMESVKDNSIAGDAVKELCNMITGNFITSAFQNSDIILDVPELLLEDLLYEDCKSPGATWFNSGNDMILVLKGNYDQGIDIDYSAVSGKYY